MTVNLGYPSILDNSKSIQFIGYSTCLLWYSLVTLYPSNSLRFIQWISELLSQWILSQSYFRYHPKLSRKKQNWKDFPRWIHIKSCIVLKASNGRRKLLQGGVSFFETRELFAGVQPLGSGLLMTAKEAQNTSYPLVNCHITMERSTIFNGKTHYKWSCSIAMLVYQRV